MYGVGVLKCLSCQSMRVNQKGILSNADAIGSF